MTFRPRFCRLTFRPKLCNSNSYPGNQLEKKNGGCTARLFVKNSDATLAVIITSARYAIFAKFRNKCLKHERLYISRDMTCCFFQETVFLGSAVDSEGPGPGPGPGPGAKPKTICG